MSGEGVPNVTELLDPVRSLTTRIQRLEVENRQLREENTRFRRRIDELERGQKKTVAPFGRDTPRAGPQPSGRRAGQGTFAL